MRRYRLAAILIGLLASVGAAAEKTPSLTDTGTFRTAFSASFYGFDICGDAETGQLYRKAIADKVAHCTFTRDAKAAFRAWGADAEKRSKDEVERYIAEHDKLPERLDRMKLNCRKERETPDYQKTVGLLAQYAKGEVGFETVIPDACDVKAGAP